MSHEAKDGKDSRVDDVISLIGEFMPSDPSSPLSTYVPGFMSLRLLLLRPSRTKEEEELVKTILDSFSSYAAGGRDRSEIVVMLARDYMFLSQQQNQQQPQQPQPQNPAAFLGLGQGMVGASAQVPAGNGSGPGGLSLFGLPSTSSSLQNSPALTPIPIPGSVDVLSIVSN